MDGLGSLLMRTTESEGQKCYRAFGKDLFGRSLWSVCFCVLGCFACWIACLGTSFLIVRVG